MNNESIELSKKLAAEQAVKENVEEGMILGIGSGSTIVYAVKKIAEMKIKVRCIPTSFQSHQLILKNKLKLVTLDQFPEIDLDIDGADEIDSDLNLIKGGGGCLLQEKIIASNSKKFVVVADYRKQSSKLGENWKKGIPIEVIPLAYAPLLKRFKNLGGKPKLRMAKAKTGPLVTDNANFIIDVDFGIVNDPLTLNRKLKTIPGVVETGLFLNMATKAYIGQKDVTSLIIEK
jgi:ribose 5-phosphate isomerase A